MPDFYAYRVPNTPNENDSFSTDMEEFGILVKKMLQIYHSRLKYSYSFDYESRKPSRSEPNNSDQSSQTSVNEINSNKYPKTNHQMIMINETNFNDNNNQSNPDLNDNETNFTINGYHHTDQIDDDDQSIDKQTNENYSNSNKSILELRNLEFNNNDEINVI